MVELCTNIHCQLKLNCAYFDKALEFKEGEYTDIGDCNGRRYEPLKPTRKRK